MGVYHLLKILIKIQAINTVKNFFDTAKKSTTDAIKTASKRAIQKTTEETGDLISNKIANKMTSILKNYHRIIYRRHRNIKKKNTCLQKKDRKLLMN